MRVDEAYGYSLREQREVVVYLFGLGEFSELRILLDKLDDLLAR